jgi:hypothetical protein
MDGVIASTNDTDENNAELDIVISSASRCIAPIALNFPPAVWPGNWFWVNDNCALSTENQLK